MIDTNVIISALKRSDSLPRQVLDSIKEGNIRHFTTSETLRELEAVIIRPKLKIPYELQVSTIKFFKKHSAIVFTHTKIEYCRDPKDNKFLECALECKADYLISGDDDLLTLKQIGRTKIISPKEFLTILKSFR